MTCSCNVLFVFIAVFVSHFFPVYMDQPKFILQYLKRKQPEKRRKIMQVVV